MPTISQVFTAIFLQQSSCFCIAQAHLEAHLSAKMAFLMTSRLH